jgi:Amt family ammonium transporter
MMHVSARFLALLLLCANLASPIPVWATENTEIPLSTAQADAPSIAAATDSQKSEIRREAVPSVLTRPTIVGAETLNGADTTWMLTSTALVLLMTLPGIALFYAGMVRKKNVLNTMASIVAIAAVVTLLWFAVGYSWAFTPGSGWMAPFLGGTQRFGFAGMEYIKEGNKVAISHIAPNIPESVYSMFQLSFAIITAALVVGSFVERMKFSAMIVFISFWTVFIYAPIAHWVWEPSGWLAQLGVLDFAGGSVVHINAGVSGLVCAYFLGVRRGYGKEPFEPFNLGLTMAGSGLLWVGWFGFNAGSAVAADGRAGLAMLVTHVAASAGAITWMLSEWLVRRRPSLLGLCSGLVAGLVAITPASGYVTPLASVLIGGVAGISCYWGATGLKRMLKADDSLDVFGVHGIGGFVGCLATGIFASNPISGAEGKLVIQLIDAVAVGLYSLFGTAVLLVLTSVITGGWRVDAEAESFGLDLSEHRERVGN